MSFANLLGFILVAGFAGALAFFTFWGKRDVRPSLREVAAFTRLRRGLGLAVEAGQRLHISLGHGGVSGMSGAASLMGLSLLQRIARTASISDYPPTATSGEAAQAILSQDVMRSAYQAVGAESSFDPLAAQLTGLTPFSYAAGALPLIYDQQVAVNVLTGSFGPEVALLADAAERTNSASLGGSENLTAQAVLYAAVQDPLVGEELFSAGAYLQAGPMHLASVRVQDLLRWVLIGLILAGAVLKFVGIL